MRPAETFMKALAIAQVVCLDWMRRKDGYIFLALLAAGLLALTFVDVFGLQGAFRYALDMGLLLVWVFSWLLALNAGSRELPQEQTRGTVYLLLSKPLDRGGLIAGKWLGAWVSVCTIVAFGYLTVALIVTSQGEHLDVFVLLQAFFLHSLGLGVLTALALLFGTRMGRDAAATLSGVVALAAGLLVPRIPVYLGTDESWRAGIMHLLYYLLPHFELFDLRRRVIHEFGPLGFAPCLAVAAYAAAWCGLLLVAAWASYRNRLFRRENLSD